MESNLILMAGGSIPSASGLGHGLEDKWERVWLFSESREYGWRECGLQPLPSAWTEAKHQAACLGRGTWGNISQFMWSQPAASQTNFTSHRIKNVKLDLKGSLRWDPSLDHALSSAGKSSEPGPGSRKAPGQLSLQEPAAGCELVFSHPSVSEGVGDSEAFCLCLKHAIFLAFFVPLKQGKETKNRL